MPVFAAYSAAWSDRTRLGSDAIALLYVEMHRADLDALLKVSNPILDFVVERWQSGTPPDRFEREFSRGWWMLFARSMGRAVVAQVDAIRTIAKNFG
jgi:catalase (peroxidase I)